MSEATTPGDTRTPTLVAAVLLTVSLAAAISVDVVRAGYGVKGDEATYVGMALSLAYDGDLAYQRRDLERFDGLYQSGPKGVFLKQGKQFHIRVNGSPPFLHVDNNTPDSRLDRLYFGKSMIYSIAAAPFVRLFGMNGFLVFHVLLLFAVAACGYLFLSAGSRAGPALTFTLAFIFASVVPAYAVLLTPDIFNFAVVFVGLFFWAYKEVGAPRSRFLGGIGSDLAAAVLLGIATYSKILPALLVVPLVLLPWSRRQWWRGFVVGAVSVVAAAVLFAGNAAITGEFNYQGGDRKQFYSEKGYPFQTPEAIWTAVRAEDVGTDDLGAQDSLKPTEIVRLLRLNIPYFLFGRHFGLVPYFFPGVVALLAWLSTRHRFVPWRVLTFVGVLLATLVLLIIFPYTWSGGGGPLGNRYFMSVYPALFFLMPPLGTAIPALLAWVGGALFTAKILVNPFVAAKNTWEVAERGFARQLPVELIMANDLPARLAQPPRALIRYGRDPGATLYFLDQHAWPPEPDGMWVSGTGRADIIVRCSEPLDRLRITAFSPIKTMFIVSAGGAASTIAIAASTPATFDVPVRGVKGFRSYFYLLSARSTEGFIPRLRDPLSQDERNLGVQMSFEVVLATGSGLP